VDVIGDTADAQEIGTDVTADCREISMHARPHLWIEPRLPILGAKDDVENEFA
jgi:hypothetical protein